MKNRYMRAAALGLAMVTAFTFTAPNSALLSAEAAAKQATAATKITAKAASVKVNKSTKVKVTINKKATKKVSISVKAKNAKIAKVAKTLTIKKGKKTANLTVKGLKKGSTKVTLSFKNSKGKTVKKTITVKVTKAASTALKGVSLSNTTPKVGDTIKAVLNPTTATNVASYSWLVDGTEVATTDSYTVADGTEGKSVQLVVTDKSGNKFESDKATISVAYARLIDVSGLQTNGKGKVKDTLRVTYTADLGNPKQITWYRSGTAIYTLTPESTGGLTFEIGAGLTNIEGNYYATITTGEGKNFTSNSIELTEEAVAAVSSDFTITDYTDEYADNNNNKYQAFDENDTKAVITVKFNKYYDGDLYLFKGNTTSYSQSSAIKTWDLDITNTGAVAKITAKSKLTDKEALDKAASGTQYGIYYMDPDKGDITYKLVTANTAGTEKVVRGTEYKLVFDQADLSTDNVVASNKNVNATEKVTAPYLPAPTAIKVTSVEGTTEESGKVEAKATVYADTGATAKMEFLGDKTNGTTIDEPNIGLTIKFYGSENEKNTNGTAFASSSEKIKAGETTEFTYSGNTNKWTGVYAELKTKSGIYGKTTTTLTSDLASISAKAATSISASYDKKNPDAIKAEVKSLKTAGKVYILRSEEAIGNPNSDCAAVVDTLGKFDPEDSSTYVGSADIDKNKSEVTVENIVTGIKNSSAKYDIYSAVFVPTNSSDFGRVKSVAPVTSASVDIDYKDCVKVAPVATTYKISGVYEGRTACVSNSGAYVTTDTSAKLVAYDQFGDQTDASEVSGGAATVGAPNAYLANGIKMDYTAAKTGNLDAGGYISMIPTGTTNKEAKIGLGFALDLATVDDVYKFKLEDGWFVKVTCTTGGTISDETAKFKIEISNN